MAGYRSKEQDNRRQLLQLEKGHDSAIEAKIISHNNCNDRIKHFQKAAGKIDVVNSFQTYQHINHLTYQLIAIFVFLENKPL